jgi:hypothetical protein
VRSLRSVALLTVFVSLPVAAQTPKITKEKPTVADIAPGDVIAVGRTIKSVKAQPKTITVRVGQTVGLDVITVTAIDSAGEVRGRLAGYDFGIAPGSAADAVPRKITGVRPGTAVLTVRYPRSGWTGRTDPRPFDTVKVVVTP